MKNKRGQVTLFVLVSIIIVAVVALFLFFKPLSKDKQTASEIKAIEGYIRDCIEKTTLDNLYLLGLQGGWITLPQNAFETNISIIAYAYYEGEKTLIPLTTLQNELNKGIVLMLPKCPDWDKWANYIITAGAVKASTKASDDWVDVDIIWPLVITKGDTTHKLKSYSARLPIRLRRIYSIASDIVDKELDNPDQIDLSYLIDIKAEQGINVDIIPYNKTLVYSIMDPESRINNKSYIFLFANKFKGEI